MKEIIRNRCDETGKNFERGENIGKSQSPKLVNFKNMCHQPLTAMF